MRERPQPIERRSWGAARLFEAHPPVLRNRNKGVVFEVACPPGSRPAGRVGFSRWTAMPLPEGFAPARAAAAVRHDGFYDYGRALAGPGGVEWHVNFADPDLFFGYGGGLFAQDEIQVTEHPLLASVREALLAEGVAARTAEGGRPTPVLVTGVERRCRVATGPDAEAGRPRGIYGNLFAGAPEEVVRRATTRLDPPGTTNVIAIAAPACGSGAYTDAQLRQVLVTAFTGFRAAVVESGPGPVAIHSGFWGCGAFGGNRVLMTLLQLLAAREAGAARLVLHLPGRAGEEAFAAALATLREELPEARVGTGEAVRRLVARRFAWGASDGN